MTRTVPDWMEVFNTASILLGVWLLLLSIATFSFKLGSLALFFMIVGGINGLVCHTGWWTP